MQHYALLYRQLTVHFVKEQLSIQLEVGPKENTFRNLQRVLSVGKEDGLAGYSIGHHEHEQDTDEYGQIHHLLQDNNGTS